MNRRNFSLILAFIALVIAALYFVFGWFGPRYNAETIPYPLLRFYHASVMPFALLLLVGAAALFLMLIARLIGQHRQLDSEHPVRSAAGAFALGLVAFLIAGAAAFSAGLVRMEHVSSEAAGGHVYQLSFWLFLDGDHRYIFYECDSIGLMCQQRHVEPIDVWRGETEGHAAIVTDENSVSLQIDGETVYSSEF